jgi:hypothetical protein
VHLRDGHQEPRQLRHFRDIRLTEQGGLRRIKPEGQQVERGIVGKFAELRRVADGRQRVQIGDEIERLLMRLQGNVLPDGAEVVAPVRPAGGLDPERRGSLIHS